MSTPLEHRLQVLIDDRRHRRLAQIASERGVSIAAVVREAIDQGLGSSELRRSAAGRRLLAAPEMPVPDPRALRAELGSLRPRQAQIPERDTRAWTGPRGAAFAAAQADGRGPDRGPGAIEPLDQARRI